MTDAMTLLIGTILCIGMTAIAFRSFNRFLPFLMAGSLWIAFSYILLDFNLILFLCSLGMGLYLLIRGAY